MLTAMLIMLAAALVAALAVAGERYEWHGSYSQRRKEFERMVQGRHDANERGDE